MYYHEEVMDLFSVDESYYLAHCISADFRLGAGIAVEFDRRFNMRSKLFERYPGGFFDTLREFGVDGGCILIDKVFNLITKRYYYQKPTIDSLSTALLYMGAVIQQTGMNKNGGLKIAMPMIGCGLDKLRWEDVKKSIFFTFNTLDLEILVCKR